MWIQEYFAESSDVKRIEILKNKKNRKAFFDFETAKFLLELKLSENEKCLVLDNTDIDDKLGFEDYVTRKLIHFPQNLAATSIKKWALETDCLLWHRMRALQNMPILPQRVRYTVLEWGDIIDPHYLFAANLANPRIGELSDAFKALIITKGLNFGIFDVRLKSLAKEVLERIPYPSEAHSRDFMPALLYLAYASESEFIAYRKQVKPHSSLAYCMEMIERQKSQAGEQIAVMEKTLKNASAKASTIISHWPEMVNRRSITSDHIAALFSHQAKFKDVQAFRDLFWGVNSQSIIGFFKAQSSSIPVKDIYNALGFMVSRSDYASLVKGQSLADRELALGNVSKRLDSLAKQDKEIIIEEQKEYWKQFSSDDSLSLMNFKFGEAISKKGDKQTEETGDKKWLLGISGQHWQDLLKGKFTAKPEQNGANKEFFNCLFEVANDPGLTPITALAAQARSQTGIASLIYIAALGKIKNSDEAVLKLLDFTRSQDETILNNLIDALSNIDTSRSVQELILCLGRNNFNITLKQKIANLLSSHNLDAHQDELKNVMVDFSMQKNEEYQQLSEILSEYITAPSDLDLGSEQVKKTAREPSKENIDRSIVQKIPQYAQLSGEVKRALRTAWFFDEKVEGSPEKEKLDLSPLIDMQYKALELQFRELFEQKSFNAIFSGVIQHKLDLIGYARPIPKAMDEFESYLKKLPIIKDIPFFSTFKLRKMLRAICQFRPGKRFTLDGLKAFGLFFLCFARNHCPYGLSKVIDLKLEDDNVLFLFCQKLHMYQDFRNRAAHEGFHPEVKADIEGIWKRTADIVSASIEFDGRWESVSKPKQSKPVIVKKVS